MAAPTGPASEPMITSGSAAVPGGPPATSASPLRNRMPSAIALFSLFPATRASLHDVPAAAPESIAYML